MLASIAVVPKMLVGDFRNPKEFYASSAGSAATATFDGWGRRRRRSVETSTLRSLALDALKANAPSPMRHRSRRDTDVIVD